MKTKYTLFRRGEVFYIQDSATGKQTSLKTKDETEAKSLLNARNEAQRQPVLNLHLARAYLTASDPAWAVKGTIAGGVIKTLGEAIIARYEKMEREGTDTAITDMPPVLESPVHAPDALHKMLNPPPITPPKIPATSGPTVDDRLQKLSDLFGKKLISQAEYDAKRQQILGEL